MDRADVEKAMRQWARTDEELADLVDDVMRLVLSARRAAAVKHEQEIANLLQALAVRNEALERYENGEMNENGEMSPIRATLISAP